jgi:serine/threonine protein kinase/Tol biopolymer transport system component
MIGKTLAHYEITSQLGKGGMGEVYQAKDTKLGRDVAIKVLPEEFARDTDRIARFQREAKLLASLNHPNIAAIHGLEEDNGIHFLVMELIEGQTLAERIKTGAIPVEESLKLALQIAEALEAAHEKGVIHRDLKPANIKVTPDGKVKVLDFGLAKAFAGEHVEVNLSQSPTLSVAATQQGVILGTAAYMSPEQARGKEVDKRVDVWAFGVVLFEMLTGRSLFSGEDVSSTLARVLEREPDFSTLPANLHPRIRLLLERCLKKESKDRYSGISDARVDIQEVLADPNGVFVWQVPAGEPVSKLRKILMWAAPTAILILIAGIIVWNLKLSEESEPPQVTLFSYELPEGIQLDDLGGFILSLDGRKYINSFAISPDGRKLVYGTDKGFYLRSMDEMAIRLIAETDETPSFLFFSPDSKWIGYWSQSDLKLKKIAVIGGAPVVLCDTNWLVTGASWCADDKIIFSQLNDGIMRVSADGGIPDTLIKRGPESLIKNGIPFMPQLLPDGKTLLYTNLKRDVSSNPKIVIQSLESEDRKELFNGVGAQYLPTGHLIYFLGELPNFDLFAVPFDPDSLELTGNHVRMLEGIISVALSESGTLAYISETAIAPETGTESLSAAGRGSTLVWVDREGLEVPISTPLHTYQHPRISPAGTKVAFTVVLENGDMEIHTLDFARGDLIRLTSIGFNFAPIWTPNGQKIVFSSGRNEPGPLGPGIYWKNADNTGKAEKLSDLIGFMVPCSWSDDDGKTLLVTNTRRGISGINYDIQMLSMAGDRKFRPLLQEEYSEVSPRVSPDGRWIAYVSDESNPGNSAEIYVRPFPDVNKGKWPVSVGPGINPLWSPDSSEIFYHVRENIVVKVMRVEVETEPIFNPGIPEVLFEGEYVASPDHPWDIHPDGKRFLMMKPPEQPVEESREDVSAIEEPPKIIVVTNWFEELKQKVPVD